MSDVARTVMTRAQAFRDFSAHTLSALVKIPSPSGKEEAVCRAIAGMCREAGCTEVRFDGLGSVVARVGTGPRKLAFDAHVDTVGVGDPAQWKLDPFSGLIADGRVHGRGAADQKGGAAAMIAAARILAGTGCPDEFTVYLAFTVFEEDCDGLCWRFLVERDGLRPDFALLNPAVGIAVFEVKDWDLAGGAYGYEPSDDGAPVFCVRDSQGHRNTSPVCKIF